MKLRALYKEEHMDVMELTHLEHDVNHLISHLETLKMENRLLRNTLQKKDREQAKLKQTNQKAVLHVQQLIAQLKEGTKTHAAN
jgi:uncharacterized protein (TIGR02449 family)